MFSKLRSELFSALALTQVLLLAPSPSRPSGVYRTEQRPRPTTGRAAVIFGGSHTTSHHACISPNLIRWKTGHALLKIQTCGAGQTCSHGLNKQDLSLRFTGWAKQIQKKKKTQKWTLTRIRLKTDLIGNRQLASFSWSCPRISFNCVNCMHRETLSQKLNVL